MSQPVMVNPIISSLSGLRNGRVFLTLATVDVSIPIATKLRMKNNGATPISAHPSSETLRPARTAQEYFAEVAVEIRH